jgi:hypothetical protein
VSRLKVAGGTEAGDKPAPPVWEDQAEGVARLLRSAAEAGLTKVALIGAGPDGDLYVASTARSAEETMGFFMRGIGFLQSAVEEPEPNGSDPA